MPLPLEQDCQILLTAISQSLGQVNGTAFGCERWNVPSLKNLHDQLQALTRGSGCQKAFLDLIEEGDEEDARWDAGPGPLTEMIATVQGVLEEYGFNNAGFDELAKATVTRGEALDIVVKQLQTDWLDVVKRLTDLYGRPPGPQIFNGEWPYPMPPAPQAVR